jgi:phosphatidylglycerophosphatase C
MSTTLAFFDLDGTITRRDTLLPYALGYVGRRPWRWPRLIIMLPAVAGYLSGLLDRGQLKGWLVRATLGGVRRSDIEAWNARFLPRLLRRGLLAEALAAIEAARARGAELVLLSASPDLYVPELAARLGFTRAICTGLRWRADQRLDGRLLTANCRGEEKARRVRAELERLQPADSIAYGNSRADLAHMALVQQAVYVNGNPAHIEAGHIRVERWRTRGSVLASGDGTHRHRHQPHP